MINKQVFVGVSATKNKGIGTRVQGRNCYRCGVWARLLQ